MANEMNELNLADCKESYIFVKFILGEKKFIFPKAFEAGFLEVE